MPVLSEARPQSERLVPPAAASWRWIHIAVAAMAMVATLPGRTHGLGLITEPLLKDLGLDRVDFAAVNLWATLLGAAFCLPVGWLLDRLGARLTLTGGAGWRTLWAGIGVALLGFCVGAWLLVNPTQVGLEGKAAPDGGSPARAGMTLGQTLRTPAFWVFALATSLYGLIASGISLFNQSILEERGFDRGVFLTITMLSPLIGLASNLATGWLAGRWPMGRLLAAAMLVLTGAL